MNYSRMKHIILILNLIIITGFKPADNDKIIMSKYIKEEKDWSTAEYIQFENTEESDNTVKVKSLWDNDSLYILFDVLDKDLRAYQTEKDHPLLYLDDMVEVLFDTKNDKTPCWAADDIVYHINLLGQKKDDAGSDSCVTNPLWDGNVNYRIQLFGTLNDILDIDTGYIVEIAFPWTELQLHPEKELKIGVNFVNGDNDGKGRQLFGWVNVFPFRLPHQFGTLILKDNSSIYEWIGFSIDNKECSVWVSITDMDVSIVRRQIVNLNMPKILKTAFAITATNIIKNVQSKNRRYIGQQRLKIKSPRLRIHDGYTNSAPITCINKLV
jgi:hypothetical protein